MTYDKTIVVTGGLGFIGSNFLNTCVLKYPNYRFVNVDAVTAVANPQNILVDTAENYIFQKVDIKDKLLLERVFTDFTVTHIIHFAAESHVDMSIKNPSIFVETNINGTHNLLNLAVKYNIKRYYQISTDEVYGSLQIDDKPFTSDSVLAPNNPYSASKAAADLLVRSYNKTFGLDTIISRCSNNYGPNQDGSKLIPKFINLLLAGKKVPLYAQGENIRDWIYVADHVDAIDTLFHTGISGSVYNIGANNEITNKNIVKKLCELTGRDESFVEYVTDRQGHDFRYALDVAELEKSMNWKAKTNFEEGIQKTFEFYKNAYNPQ